MTDAELLWITRENDRETPGLREFLLTAENEARVRMLTKDEFAACLDGDVAQRVIGAIFAPSVPAPVLLAQRFLRRFPGSEVIFLLPADSSTPAKEALSLSSMHGHHRTIRTEDSAEGVRQIRSLLQRARRQRQSRWTLGRLNEQVARVRKMELQAKAVVSNQLLAGILAQSPDALLALDRENFLLAVNQVAEEKFNLPEAEGMHFDDTSLAKSLPQLKALIAASKESEEPRRQEIRWQPTSETNPEPVYFEASANPVFYHDKTLFGITLLLRDVTVVKVAEQNLREMNESLERHVQERTRELKELNRQMEAFLYSAAHDMRAPIRAIISFSQLLQEHLGDQLDEQSRCFLRRIVDGTKRMDLLIHDLLAYSSVARARLPLAPVDLDTAVDTARAATADEAAESGAEIRIEPCGCRVIAHQMTLEQAVINLLSNALHHSRPNLRARIRVFGEPKSDRWRLCVQDNGIGIDPAYHERIFEIFERLDVRSGHPGTGIGLAIVKGGIERMGGSVGVESEPGKGSLFWIELPVAPGAPDA